MFTKTDIEKYFLAEKSESLLFMLIGIAAIVAAIIFYFIIKTNWCKGACIPFLIVGIIHTIIGFIVFNRSDSDRIKNVYAYDMNISELKQRELPRMEIVNRNFMIYRYTEIILFAAGLILFFLFKTDKQFWAGFGIALAIEALISLSADYFAEKRAIIYSEGLKEYVDKLP